MSKFDEFNKKSAPDEAPKKEIDNDELDSVAGGEKHYGPYIPETLPEGPEQPYLDPKKYPFID